MIRSLHPTGNNSKRTRKVDKLYVDKWDFKDMIFLVKVRDIYKIERKSFISTIFLVMKRKSVQPKCKEKHVDLLLISEWEKKHHALNKDFNTFMHDYTLQCERKHFWGYC